MRIGYIGYFGDWHTEWGVSNALEKYAEVDRYCTRFLDKRRFTERDYDIVLTTAPYAMPAEFWKVQRGLKVAHYFDLIVGWKGREKQYFPALRNFDLVLSTDGSRNRAYEKAGINRRYFLQAFNPEWYFPVNSGKYEQELAFIGGVYTHHRRLMLHTLARRFDVRHYGWDNACRGREHAKVCAESKIMVCDNAVNDLPGYWSNRVYLHLACGAFVLHPRVPGMEKVFKGGEHLVYYDSLNDLCEKVAHYLPLESERKRIATAGCKEVHRRHTWDARMEEFWRVISELGFSDIQIAPAG